MIPVERMVSAPSESLSRNDWITAEESDGLGAAKGAYVLLILLDRPVQLRTGRFAAESLVAGQYLYVGSAKGSGGLSARLRRHFRTDKKQHWHVDQLTVQAKQLAALPVEGGHECELALELLKRPGVDIALDGFGSSDCKNCRSHLLVSQAKFGQLAGKSLCPAQG